MKEKEIVQLMQAVGAAEIHIWMDALLVNMRFLRTQIREPQIWADWKCSRLIPLVMQALCGPKKALQ